MSQDSLWEEGDVWCLQKEAWLRTWDCFKCCIWACFMCYVWHTAECSLSTLYTIHFPIQLINTFMLDVKRKWNLTLHHHMECLENCLTCETSLVISRTWCEILWRDGFPYSCMIYSFFQTCSLKKQFMLVVSIFRFVGTSHICVCLVYVRSAVTYIIYITVAKFHN